MRRGYNQNILMLTFIALGWVSAVAIESAEIIQKADEKLQGKSSVSEMSIKIVRSFKEQGVL